MRPTSSGKGTTNYHWVEGEAAIREHLRHAPQTLHGVFAKEKVSEETLGLLRKHDFSVQQVKEPPEGVRAPCWAKAKIEARSEDYLFDKVGIGGPPLILALDHITDPRNLGAIMRTAGFFGIRYVVAPERRQVLITQASVATAQGGFAKSELVVVVNLRRTLERLKEARYWIIGADMGGEPAASLVGFYEQQVLVLGAEDKGLSDVVRKVCDRFVSIPGADHGLESLNVSVAAGILVQLFSAPFLG